VSSTDRDRQEPNAETPRESPSRDLQLGLALQRDRRFAEAAYRFRAALKDDGDSFDAAFGLGVVLLELGKPDEAVASLENALRIDDRSAEAHVALAQAWERLLQWEKAVDAYERSLTLRPADQRTLMLLGGALSRLDRRAELNGWYEKAIAAEPETAMLHGMLAGQLFAFGRTDEAVRAMDRMLALDPVNGHGYAFLSEMKKFAPGDPHLAPLERAAKLSESRPADERCSVLFALGKAYADLGRHEESFLQYQEANRVRRRTMNYDVSLSLSEFERLKTVFTPDFIQARHGAGDPSERPVFIVGMMRSGSSLVEQILTAHREVHGNGEIPNFRVATRQVVQAYPEEVPRLRAGDLRRVADFYLQLTGTGAGDAARVTDKTLSNDMFVGLIHLALPNARIIHCVRDPVDTCLSIFSTNFGTQYGYACDLAELGRFCRAEYEMMAHWRGLLPASALLEIRYENIVADLEGETRRMLDFCKLEWDPACLAFEKSKRPVWTASAAQIRRPLYSNSVGRWRPAPDVLKPLLDGLGEYAPPAASRLGFTG
jgi:tetratricopeptide (TPR) repeat protein